MYQERVSGHVIPCIGQLAFTVGDDALRKTLNYQILLKARHTSAKVTDELEVCCWGHDYSNFIKI